MAETQEIVGVLKQQLRSRGVTYRDVATGLGLSHSSVKRLFSTSELSLQRLEQICSMIDLRIVDLTRILSEQGAGVDRLTLAQEQTLVDDTELLLVATLVLTDWGYGRIHRTYRLTPAQLTTLLLRLDKLGLLELLPNNRIKLRVSPDFTWVEGGPIEEFFATRVQRTFLNSEFKNPGELRLFSVGALTRESNAIIQRRIKRLTEDFRRLHNDDRETLAEERFGTSMVLAMRPWELPEFQEFRRQADSREF